MSFFKTLETKRQQMVVSTNERFIQAINEFFQDKHPPIQEMKEDLERAAMNTENNVISATYRISLQPLFLLKPPLCLYTTTSAVTTTANELSFISYRNKSLDEKLEKILVFDKEHNLSRFEGITSIMDELKDAFPEASIIFSYNVNSSYPEVLFRVRYTMKEELKPYFIG